MFSELIYRTYLTGSGEQVEQPEEGKTYLRISLYGPASRFSVNLEPIGEHQRIATGMPLNMNGARRLRVILKKLEDIAQHYEVPNDM